MHITLKPLPTPEFTFVETQPAIPTEEYERRLSALYAAAHADWVAVYADREHYANLVYLLNFDPRFEEALLLLGPGGRRVLVLGNEDMGYTSVLPFPVELVLCQTFSLSGQPRQTSANLKAVLSALGLCLGQTVSLVGWKYLEQGESDDPATPAFVPAFIVDVLRSLVSPGGRVVDGTALLMHPQHGLRAFNSAAQIAAFEWAARNAAAAVFGVLRLARPGMSEMGAMQHMRYAGQPMSMHPIFVSGKGELNGLRSPGAKLLEYGDAVSTAVGYWGSLVCRAGLLLGEPDWSFFEEFVAPYFRALAAWYTTARLGASGDELFQAVSRAFAGSPLRSLLNPGHLGSYDEWLHSPVRPGSSEKIASGMVFQSDIIPTPLPPGRALNCEDTVAFADAALRAEIRAAHPQLWERVQHRRRFIQEALGLALPEELLPLSDGALYLPPFWLAADVVCAVTDEGARIG
jgi:hypothetical protein